MGAAQSRDVTEVLRSVIRAASVLDAGALESKFLDRYANRQGAIEDFWAGLRQDPDLQTQVDQLQFAMQLGLLTRNHAPLIQALQKTPGVRSTRDLMQLDSATWSNLVSQAGVPPVIPGSTPQEQATNYANAIIGVLHAAFPSDAIAQIAAKAPNIHPLVSKFFANSPDFDVCKSHVDTYASQHGSTAFSGIVDADKPKVVQEVKRLQRLFQVSTNANTMSTLLSLGLDSAHTIANMPRQTFLAQHGTALGSEQQAAMIHERAQFLNARTLHVYTQLNDALHGARATALGDGASQLHQDLIKRFPNYSELFGPLDLCDCKECRSVLSPAAYLVDLLEFLRGSMPNAAGHTPLDVLLGRRPDLQYLPLTCENTNTAMPYVDLVNEVLESYIALGLKLDATTAHDTGDATSQELNANPQYTNDQAYQVLDQAVYPFTLPFNQPVTMARAYLKQLGSSRHEMLKAFQKQQNATTTSGVNAEHLGITRAEYQILTGKDFDPNAVVPTRQLREFYGYPQDLINGQPWKNALEKVPEFLQRTGIEYVELVELVKTRFLNPAYPEGQALEFFLKMPFSFATLTQLVQSNFANPSQAERDALQNAGIALPDLVGWANANYQKLTTLIVLDAPDSTCDREVMNLVHLNGTQLDDRELSKLHRFIRLWRKLGWRIADLDRVLTALQATDITPAVVDQLAQIAQLQSDLNVPNLQILLSLWAPIETHGDDALYTRLFLSKAALNKHDPDFAVFQPQSDGSVLTQDGLIRDHVPAVLAGLRISAADLVLICADAGLEDHLDANPPTFAPLNLANLSALYRYAALAQALRLRIADFIALKTLSGINPFAAPNQTLRFQAVAAKVQQSGFKIAQLSYLYRHLTAPPANLAPQATTLLLLAKTLRDGLAKIEQDNAVAPDPSGDLTRAKLSVLFDSATVEQTIAMIAGTAIYSATLRTLPDVLTKKNRSNQVTGIDPAKVPASVAKKLSYDPKAAALRFQGAMTTAEKGALGSASSDPDYQAAVNDLFQQPITFIQNTLSGFLAVNDAKHKLVQDTPSLDQDLKPVLLAQNGTVVTDLTTAKDTAIAEKFAYLLGRLLPYVRTQLSHTFVKQTIASALNFEDAIAQLLLETVLKSQVDPTQPALADLLALATSGLTAAYFTSNDLSGTPSVRTDPAVAFDSSGSTPDMRLPTNAQSARWSGMLLAPNNGAFTFAVRADGIAQLWIGDAAVPLPPDPSTNESVSQPLTLKAGQLYDLRLELTAIPPPAPQRSSVAELLWQSASLPRAPIPSDNLYPHASLDNLTLVFTRLQKIALLVNTFQLTAQEVAYCSGHAADFANLDLNALPLGRDATSDANVPALFAAWQRLHDLVTLRNGLPKGEVSLIDVFGATSLAEAQTRVAQATGWDPQIVSALVGTEGFGLAAPDFKNEIWLMRLQNRVRLIKRLGVSAPQLFAWANLGSDFEALEAVTQDIKKTVQAKYDSETWLTVARTLNDPLRESQRDALVSYLLPRMDLDDPNQLFEYFLIDTEMGACMQTSRVKQALSSVQLFVQRCLLNLEERAEHPALSVTPSQIDAGAWEWMKHYRVWEANRKVFLYPENWIEPELRDNKSPFFKELESELLQNDLTTDNAETAFLHYLEKLDQVARLEIAGMYWQAIDPDTCEWVNTLHVFARTFQSPHIYYYRRLLNGGEWTPWEKMQVDIQGDHLIPAIWNRRLYIFWPQFVKKANPPSGAPSINLTSGSVSAPSPQPYWEISLNWSEYKQGKWSPKQVAKQVLQLEPKFFYDDDPTKYSHYRYVFGARVGTDPSGLPANLVIGCGYHDQGTETDTDDEGRTFSYSYNDFVFVGEFDFGGCTGETVNAQSYKYGEAYRDPVTPAGADFEAMTFAEQPARSNLTMTGQDGSQALIYLQATPTPYRLLYPHQFQNYLLQAPFFYQDAGRTYFAVPREAYSISTQIATPTSVNLVRAGQVTTLPTTGRTLSLHHPGATSAAAGRTAGTVARYLGGPSGVVGVATGSATAPAGPATHAAGLAARAPTALALTGAVSSAPTNATAIVPARPAEDWAHTAAASMYHWHDMVPRWWQETVTTDLAFDTFYHPFVCEFTKGLTRQGIRGLLTEQNQQLGNPYLYFPWYSGQLIATGVTSPGCIIESSFGKGTRPGNFEVVVLKGNELWHYWHDNSDVTKPWAQGQLITTGATGPGCIIESSFGKGTRPGNFEVVVLKGNELWHYWHDNSDVTKPWAQGQRITDHATGPGWIVQDDIRDGWNGNFEVVVPEGHQLVHYWHDNSDVNAPWMQGRVITTKATGPGCIIQSSFRPPGLNDDGNFEVVALEGDRLVHYWHVNFRFFFCDVYGPTSNVQEPFPREEVDFRYSGAYSLYNWELFFHTPLLIATRLSENRRFEDAVKWFHYIFNPTDDSPSEVAPARYWKLLPFKSTPRERILDIMMTLDAGDPNLVKQVDDWRHHPFLPHRLARLRLGAYQKYVFMKYLDNLIMWGDQLFQQDTIESINEAEQLYVLAADLLGPRPQRLPARGTVAQERYIDLKGKLDKFSNALVQLENEFPFSSGVTSDPTSESGGLLGVGKTLYFCIPQNDTLLRYWDTVADRLFKIRHCMNIEGVVQQLPLFEPPIDPALLVQAAAQGVDLASVLSDLSAPLPYYRFSYMLQKALEICSECRSLGAALLSALEKKDAEYVGLLRATHETNVLNMMEDVKKRQEEEANDQVAALGGSRQTAETRYLYYQTLLTGQTPPVPATNAKIPLLSTPNEAPVNVGGSIQLLPEESGELDSSHSARDWQVRASTMEILSGLSHYIPTFRVDIHFWGLGADVEFGGQHIGPALAAVARQQMNLSGQDSYDASHAAKMGGYFRRLQEWTLQSNLAACEIMQIDQQITAANVRAAIAHQELLVHQQQMKDAQEIQDFLTSKYTNQDLYSWMIADIAATYFQCYQMAYDLAKKAERTFRFERGLTDSNFIQFGYWDSLRKGLQSGERLYLALKQMERAYQDQNRREYEITKHVSLLLQDPLALVALKETGRCEVELSEALFDADYPGHYMRRLKSVSLTIPCVVGPYTSINCTLTLLSNKTRTSSLAGGQYAENMDGGDDRFVTNFAAMQSITTSHAQNDSGMFELNFHDERYLPFEGAGAISRWRIDLPKDTNAFAFNTLTDVVLHLKYTAREGGEILRNAAKKTLSDMLADDQNAPLARLFMLRHECPTEWYRFLHPTDVNATSQLIQMDLGLERFPFQMRGKKIQISQMELFLSFTDPSTNAVYQSGQSLVVSLTAGNMTVSGALVSDPVLGQIPHLRLDLQAQVPVSLTLTAAETAIQDIATSLRQTLGPSGATHQRLNADLIDDILVVCHYSVSSA
jgi:hypothetical protein